MDITKLIRPRSVAVVGASARPSAVGFRVARACLCSANSQRVYLVNPKGGTLFERPCYRTLAEVPEVVDSVVLCTPRERCAGILEEAGALGVEAAVVYASGFSEEGSEEGRRLERELLDICERYDMAMLGPNCAGFTNNIDKVFHTMPGIVLEGRPTGVGILSQSGFIATSLTQPEYMHVSYGFSTGNGNRVRLEDCMEFLVEDPDTKVLAVYLEGVRDGAKFVRLLARAHEKGKPVVLLKTGRSARGARATASHTGSISGTHGVYQSFFDKYNVISVDSLQELIYTAQAVSVLVRAGKLPKGGRVASINISGAENVLCADMGEAAGVVHAELSQATKDHLARLLPPFATPANPLDATTHFFNRLPETVELLQTMGGDPEVDAVTMGVEVDGNPTPKDMSEIRALAEAARTPGMKPLFAMCSLEATRDADCRRLLEEAGVPILGPATIGYRILGGIMAYAARPDGVHDLTPVGGGDIRGERRSLTEWESKELLRTAGVPLPAEAVVRSRAELAEALKGLSFPVALKINSPDIAHKSDAGGVKLNLQTPEEAAAAYDAILESCRAYAPDARLDGALLSEMVEPGLEFIVGVNNDPQLGPVVLAGLGGVFVELFRDCAMCPAPVSPAAARAMLRSLKAYPLLSGYRGGPVYDEDALAELIVRVSHLAADRRDVLWEVDVNPVIVLPKGRGAVAVDALAVVSGEA